MAEQQAWFALLQKARGLRDGGDEGAFLVAALEAFELWPARIEPLYDIARYFRERGMNHASVLFSRAALRTALPPQGSLHVEEFVYRGGILEEFSIAANYAIDPALKARGHAACDWLALGRDVPPRVRDLARLNLFFYTEPAANMFPSFMARQLHVNASPGFHPSNPSITRSQKGLVVAQRTVNVVLTEEGQYHLPDGGPEYSRNYLLTLDCDFGLISAVEIQEPADLPPPRFGFIRGFQDMRLFEWRGQLWGCATVRELNDAGLHDMVLVRLLQGPGSAIITDWCVMPKPEPQRDEKNWMPLVDGEELGFVYSSDPTLILAPDGRKIVSSIPPVMADSFRGSSQVIAFDGGWLALVHEVTWRDGRRVYEHRFVWLDGAKRLRRITRRFVFNKKGIEFAAGLAWHPDGQDLVMSYGVDDQESWVARLSAEDVRRRLMSAQNLEAI